MMDPYGWYIATMHGLLGHDTAARFIGQPPGDKTVCVLCIYEKNPTDENRAAVLTALRPP